MSNSLEQKPIHHFAPLRIEENQFADWVFVDIRIAKEGDKSTDRTKPASPEMNGKVDADQFWAVGNKAIKHWSHHSLETIIALMATELGF